MINPIAQPQPIPLFEKLKQDVFVKRPVLKTILSNMGGMTMYDISRSNQEQIYVKNNTQRKKEFIDTFKEETELLLGKKVAQCAANQLEKYNTVSTAEHHGPLTHANLFNSSLNASLQKVDSNMPNNECIIVMACANISFDNYSIPRGLLFNSTEELKPTLNQLVFFPRSARPCPVIFYKGYTGESIQTAKKRIDLWLKE